MVLLTRIVRLWKADLHGVMDQLEDKELVLKQSLREMRESLTKKQQESGMMASSVSRLNSHIESCEQDISKINQDLEQSIKKENDELAKLLIRNLRVQQASLQELKQQKEILEQEYAQLVFLLREQRFRYEAIRNRADVFLRQTERERNSRNESSICATSVDSRYAEHEIELELMRRKEGLADVEEVR